MTTELSFEWNSNNATQNAKKHRVSFEEASTVFNDTMFITFIDDEHSVDEERYITIGLSTVDGRSYGSSGPNSHHKCA